MLQVRAEKEVVFFLARDNALRNQSKVYYFVGTSAPTTATYFYLKARGSPYQKEAENIYRAQFKSAARIVL